MSTTHSPSHEEISRRAHQLWEESGRGDGNDTGHWLQAERELRARHQPSGESHGTPGRSGGTAPRRKAPCREGTAQHQLRAPRRHDQFVASQAQPITGWTPSPDQDAAVVTTKLGHDPPSINIYVSRSAEEFVQRFIGWMTGEKIKKYPEKSCRSAPAFFSLKPVGP